MLPCVTLRVEAMKTLGVALVAVALSAAVARADDQPVFKPSPRLAPAASFVAGKPVVVLCAASDADWTKYLHGLGATDANGATVPGSSETRLSAIVCRYLAWRLGGKTPSLFPLAAAVETLTHESIHARGEVDEGKTDCAAMHEMVAVSRRFFGVTSRKTLRSLMAFAWQFHARQSPPYKTVC
jgi:hypothetical protein